LHNKGEATEFLGCPNDGLLDTATEARARVALMNGTHPAALRAYSELVGHYD
jgi:hypothetical protein